MHEMKCKNMADPASSGLLISSSLELCLPLCHLPLTAADPIRFPNPPPEYHCFCFTVKHSVQVFV